MIEKMRAWARTLKAEIVILAAAVRDPRTPWYAKILGVIIVAYALSPIDLIPDFIPVLGYLDDAIAIELSVRELKHEIDAYSEFCEYRQEQAASRGLDAAAVGRADWLSSRRDELINRMHRRRNLDGSGSYGSSSGYGGGKSYVSNAWRPGLLRVR